VKAHLSSILPRALQRLARRAAACATLLALALACNPAAAQNVLFLHTNEPTHPDADLDAYTNLKNEFTAAGATITDVGGLQTAGSISAATFTAPSGGAYDLVIMASAYVQVDAAIGGPSTPPSPTAAPTPSSCSTMAAACQPTSRTWWHRWQQPAHSRQRQAACTTVW
jgi:hypothetical protein